MVAEQEASVQLLVGNDDRAAEFLPTETGLRGWACRTRSAPGDRQGVGGASPLR
jgi:hypothetical protein